MTDRYKNGLALAVAVLLLAACVGNEPRSSSPQTKSIPTSSNQALETASRERQQGGGQAQRPARSPQEAGGDPSAAGTEAGSQSNSARAQAQGAQQQAQPSDPKLSDAHGGGQATKTGVTSSQGDRPGAAAQDVSIGAYAGGRTDEERRQDLDGDLNRSLAEFDKRLQREQSELDQEETARAAALRAAKGGGGDIATGRQALERATAPPPPESADGGGDQPDLARGEPIPGGEDDDVVARQLREAAQNETDPALRKKLWEEYREYKENSG